jgi:hypothetical protein
MDQRTFGRMFLGRQPGQRVSGKQLEDDKKQYEYFVKKSVDEFFKSQQGSAPQPQFMSLTNAEGRVIDVMVKPDGEPVVVEPKVQNTQQGMFTMANPTNAVPIVDPRTGQQLQGYAADPYAGAPTPAPLAGGGMAATNAPTAAPVQTPAPSPTPFPEGAVIRSKRDGKSYRIVNGQPVLVGP